MSKPWQKLTDYARGMRVDVWSDVVCPWCYIGFVRLNKALAEFGDDTVEIYHHAFQLDPNAEGAPVNTAEHLAGKYGVAVEDAIGMMGHVTEIAAGEGLDYKLAQTMSANTRDAHRLLAFAATKGMQHELLIRLFNAYFEHAHNIFSSEDLLPIAVAAGLNQSEAAAVLEGDEFSEVVDYDRNLATEINIQGVPFFIFNQRVALSGAESVDTMLKAMARADELEKADQSQ